MLVVVIALLTGISFLSGFSVAGWDAKPVRLYSDLTKGIGDTEDDFPDDSLLWAQMEKPLPSDPAETGTDQDDDNTSAGLLSELSDPGNTSSESARPVEEAHPKSHTNTVPIEDFSENRNALSYFFQMLDQRDELNRPVRVAFLGDSFVEGDILTSDLREFLQERFGGRGVGFIPLAPIDRYRNTMNIEHGGWKIYNSLYGSQKAKYLLNGQCFEPEQEEAYTKIQATNQREHAKNFNTASLLYASEEEAVLYYKLGGAEEKETVLKNSGNLQLLEMKRQNMRSAEFRVAAEEGFTGYGLFLNDETGVCVDNYSLRSSSGMQLQRVGPNLLTRMHKMIPYDLVVLQYGMNVMEAERKNYDTYADNMVRIIKRLQEAMPEVSILLFGVGDRNFKNEDGEMVTKVGVISLVEAQRRIAQETEVAFWNTYLAMGGRNSMGSFVHNEPPLANKDYTHINYLGGKRIGLAFGEALLEAKGRYE